MCDILYFIGMVCSLLSTLAYFWLVSREGGLPDSMSSIAYRKDEKPYLWALWLWFSTFTMTPALFYVIHDESRMVVHAFATSILLLGIVPFVKTEYKGEVNKAHRTLGLASCLFSQICVASMCPMVLLLWMVTVLTIRWKRLFIVEATSYVCLFIGTLVKLLGYG